MSSLRHTTFANSVGNINSSTTPTVIAAPTGLAAGDLLVVSVFFAQLLGNGNTVTPADMTKATANGTSTNRLAAVFYAKVVDPSDFASGISLTSNNATGTRVAAVAQAWIPTSGFSWDVATAVAAGPEWNGSSHSSDTFPSISSRDLMLGIGFTNKGASTTLTTHTAAGGGTDIQQARSPSALSGSVSDSVVSVTRGGTGLTYNIAQANGMPYSFGIDEVEEEPPPPTDSLVRSFTSADTGTNNAFDLTPNPSGLVLPAPAGLAIGDLHIVAAWVAQGPGSAGDGYTEPYATLGYTRLHEGKTGTSTNRLMHVWGKVMEDSGDLTDADDFTVRAAVNSTRAVAFSIALLPPEDQYYSIDEVELSAPVWSGSGATSQNFPATPSSRPISLSFTGTNNASTSTHPVHSNVGGELIAQGIAYGGASDPRADSVFSFHEGGTSAEFTVSTANQQSVTLGITALSSIPPATGGFSSVRQMMETRGATWAHRNLGGTYPEMTEYGVQQAAGLGYGVIEISLQRTSDGVFIGSHDATPNRVALETTHDGTNFSSLTSAQVLAMSVNVGTTGGPRPFATLQELVETLPTDYVFLVDPKSSAENSTYRTEFLDQVDTLLGPTRAIIKLDAYAHLNTFIAAKARGYMVATYFYAAPSTPTGSTIVEARLPYTDLPGLNYDADQAGWDDYLDPSGAYYSLAQGKPMWGHVCASQANHDMARAKGATFVQCTSATITPVGVEAWRPGAVGGGFAPTEIYAGTTLIQKVYRGTTLVWQRP